MAPRKLFVQSADAGGRAEGHIEEHAIASASRALRGLRALACAYTPCTGTGRSPDWPSWWSAQGRHTADACDARLGEVRHQHSVCLAAHVSGGFKSRSARGHGLISKGGGNASRAEGGGRYGDADTGTQAQAGHSQGRPEAT